jgi:hypothetical protein
MGLTRREFLRGVGVAMASLAMTGCSLGLSRDRADDSPRGRLRSCWLRLDNLAETTKKDYETGEQLKAELAAGHRAALDDLVSSGGLTAIVADQVQAAFDEALYHVWRANAPVTCYEPMIVNYTPTSADQLVQQASLLAGMAKRGDLDPDTVQRARMAIERDIAFLSLTSQETDELYQALQEAAGDSFRFPSFEELALEIPVEAIEATHFLVDLLTEQS